MLGHRGCRLGITYPEIYEMQVEAIFEASINAKKKRIKALPEIGDSPRWNSSRTERPEGNGRSRSERS